MSILYGIKFNGFRNSFWVKNGFAVCSVVFLLVLAGNANAQNPVLSARFANPNYDCDTGTYCLDVEFQADTPDQRLFNKNVRLFYDDDVLRFLGYSDFADGYGVTDTSPPTVGNPDSGQTLFTLGGPAAYINNAIELVNPASPPVIISTTDWTWIYSICFDVSDSADIGLDTFCPSVIWDLEEDPSNGGFLTGSNGVVMTVVAQPPAESAPADEHVIQFNWHYSGLPDLPYGFPVEEYCTDTICDVEGEPAEGEGEPDPTDEGEGEPAEGEGEPDEGEGEVEPDEGEGEGEGEPAEGEGEPDEGEGEVPTVQLPNIDDMTEQEARDALEALGFVVRIETDCPSGCRGCRPMPAGTILDQDPPPGTDMPAGSLITITVSDCPTGLLNMGVLGDIFAAIVAFFGLIMFWCMFDRDSPIMIN